MGGKPVLIGDGWCFDSLFLSVILSGNSCTNICKKNVSASLKGKKIGSQSTRPTIHKVELSSEAALGMLVCMCHLYMLVLPCPLPVGVLTPLHITHSVIHDAGIICAVDPPFC